MGHGIIATTKGRGSRGTRKFILGGENGDHHRRREEETKKASGGGGAWTTSDQHSRFNDQNKAPCKASVPFLNENRNGGSRGTVKLPRRW